MELLIAIEGNNAVRTPEHLPSNSLSRKVTGISEEIVLIKPDFLHYDEVLQSIRLNISSDTVRILVVLFSLVSWDFTTSSHLFHGATQSC